MKEKVKVLVENKIFTLVVFTLIVINSITLGIETFVLPDSVNQMLSVFNVVCMCVFSLEIVLKLYAYGGGFFKDGWNIFDMVIVIISILPMITFLSSMRVFRVFRMFRAFRALRVMNQLDKLRVIVNALLNALPSVGWVVVLLVIIYYVFAVIGTNLFGSLSPEYFGTLWKSLYSLFQITMADDLGNISRPLLESGISAVVYFVSFVVISAILVLNVIVGVVVDSVAEIKNSSGTKKNGFEELSKDTVVSDGDLLKEIEAMEQQMERIKKLVADGAQK